MAATMSGAEKDGTSGGSSTGAAAIAPATAVDSADARISARRYIPPGVGDRRDFESS